MKTNEMFDFFCKNVKIIREQNHLSKKEMAKILGIGLKSLSSIENGKIPPRLKAEVLIKIYRYFGILPSEMMNEAFKGE